MGRSELWYSLEEVVQSVCGPESQEVVQSEAAGPAQGRAGSAQGSLPRLVPQQVALSGPIE